MTAHENSPPPRTLQEELLQDLLQTAPMPDPRGGTQGPGKRQAIEAAAEAAGVELRVSRTRWLSPSMRLASKGIVLSAGPISVSVALSGRS